jgi:flagellar basal-body rod modification protein FlgD
MSSISPVSKTTATGTAGTMDTTPNPSQTLNQNDFLKLLVSQIQYQDPMNPKSDTDMAAQMAQFTSLQQASQSTTSLAMLQANSLLGSTVTVPVDLQNPTAGTFNGVVNGVVMNNGTPQITVGGNTYNLSQVMAVLPTVTQTNPTTN